MGIEHAQEKDVCGNYVILVQSSCLKEKRKKLSPGTPFHPRQGGNSCPQ